MTVTNLETSRKLKELGFESDEGIKQYVGAKEFFGKGVSGKDMYYIGYLLETILEALPKTIEYTCGNREYQNDEFKLAMGYLEITFVNSSPFISYICSCHNAPLIETCEEENESLANTAGRLLIKLVQENIIKLGD